MFTDVGLPFLRNFLLWIGETKHGVSVGDKCERLRVRVDVRQDVFSLDLRFEVVFACGGGTDVTRFRLQKTRKVEADGQNDAQTSGYLLKETEEDSLSVMDPRFEIG